MDDGIELNFAPAGGANVVRTSASAKRGGRWTERVKAKRAARDIVRARPAEASQQSGRVAITAPPVPVKPPTPSSQPSARTTQPIQQPSPPVASPKIAVVPQKATANASPARPSSVISRPTPRNASASSRAPPSRPLPIARDPPAAGPSRPSTSTSKGPQIISSLFTSNPATLPKAAKFTPTIGAPSNAPNDTSTFEGLGLDPLLVRHLKGKMKVDRPTGIQKSALPYLLSSPLDPNRRVDDGPEEPLRDVFIQSQTGSGKTLAYLLPIVQTLLPLSRLSYIDRSIGTLAIILAPTRELAQQISKVLEQLLSMSLSSEDDDEVFARWLVAGLLTGGSTRTHEKARLRKGVPILVSTPGRLLDHLQNTSSFKCSKTMFLVLDEADRLMDLGFEETILGIIKALEGRRKIEINGEKEMDEEGGGTMRWPFWGRGRRTVLCSATIDAKVEKLAGMALREPILFKDESKERTSQKQVGKVENGNGMDIPVLSDKFTPPSQLSQKYVVAPIKLRLVTLVAMIRSLIAVKEGTKVIVFLSSTDAVDFHWKLLGGVSMSQDGAEGEEASKAAEDISLKSALFPSTTLHRLHGSLPLKTRLASLKAFSEPSPTPSILFATSVASRGLDLPLVRAVIQYDLPTEGGANEYVHRVGRTARAGKGGEAWSFVGPSEADWVPWVEEKMGSAEGQGVRLGPVGVEDVLKKGFGGKGYEYEQRATDVQLAFERWVLASDENASLARKAFSSYIRAYSTHPLEEKKFFHPKSLHLGHLAKSFALREAPGALAGAGASSKAKVVKSNKRKREGEGEGEDGKAEGGGKESTARNETERRMYEAVRKATRSIRSEGKMGQFGDSEFQVMGGGDVERMGRK